MWIDIVKRLAPEPRSVPDSRAALSPLEQRFDPATLETVRVLVNELVTESVRHAMLGGSDIELTVNATRERIRVEVTDPTPGFASPNFDLERGSLWGRELVEAFSDRWGTVTNGRKFVWFELHDSGAFALRAPVQGSVSGPPAQPPS